MKKNAVAKNKTIFRWFFRVFTIIALLFCLALVPLFIYQQNTFADLQLEKARHHFDSGISQIESVVTDTLNISQVLSEDSRFFTLRYEKSDYTTIPANIRIQLGNIFSGLSFPLEAASHVALQFAQNVVITTDKVFFEDHTCYYPDFFCVNDLSYEAWMQLLVDNGSGFLPVSTIKTNRKEYTALIFSSKWTNSAYIYSCIDIADIKDMLIADSDQEGYYFSIARTNGELLYTNLPENLTNYQILSRNTQVGNLVISVYIDNSVFFQSMKPMYLFLTLYGVTCFALLLVVILLGTKLSAKPVLNIIDVLENCKNILSSNTTDLTSPPQPSARSRLLGTNRSSLDSFDYIANSFRQADRQSENYQNVIRTQTQILRARYMEKAISNQLISAKEISQFHSYFPDFPDQFCLALFQLQAYEALDQPPYSNPLLLLQSFLQNELPNIYQQQLSDTELLLLMDNADFEHCRTILDFLVDNINREEPYYVARCVASKPYDQPEQLSTAYRQLQETEHFIFSDDRTHVCMTDEYPDVAKFPFTMSELITLYNAISYGNREMALSLLNTFSEELKQAPNRGLQKTVFEMLRTILSCIKLEHPTELINEYVPERFSKEDLSLQLCETIGNFCDRLNESKLSDIDPFAQKILEFIDVNYTDPDLCMTTLETHFKCVSSTLRKAFKNATGITITGYIEQKRMERANELLAQNLKPVIEIAIECGYTNQNSFYKAYKRVHGHAPTAYTQTE